MSRSHRKRLHSKERRLAKRYLRNNADMVLEYALEQAKQFPVLQRLRMAVLLVAGKYAGALSRWAESVVQLPRLAWQGLRLIGGDVGRLLLIPARFYVRQVLLWGTAEEEPNRKLKVFAYWMLLCVFCAPFQLVLDVDFAYFLLTAFCVAFVRVAAEANKRFSMEEE